MIVEKRISPIRGKKLINTDLCVRDFLLVYELLVESICFFFYHDEVSLKKNLIELSESCTVMMNNVERKERIRKQS